LIDVQISLNGESTFHLHKLTPDSAICSAAAGQYTSNIASLPYAQTGLNVYDYRTNDSYDERGIIAYFNNATIQAELGVISDVKDGAKLWEAHSPRVWAGFVYSGDWDIQTDIFFERLLRSGVSILKYEGMVDCEFIRLIQDIY
jgi:hypothetical protein